MLTYKEVLKPVKKIETATCDRCKKSITGHKLDNEEFLYIKYTGGYFSEYPGDCMKLECVLCEECMKEIFGDFANLEDVGLF